MVFDKIDINGDGKEASHATLSSALSFSFPAARFAGAILGVGCPVAVGGGRFGSHCPSIGPCVHRGTLRCGAELQWGCVLWLSPCHSNLGCCGGCGWRTRAAGHNET